VSAGVGRIGSALRVGPYTAWLIVAIGLVGVAVLTAVATRQGMLPMALGLVIAGLATLVGLRWPLVVLLIFVALIPVEAVVQFGGFGTIGRFAGILFAVAYVGSQVGRVKFTVMPVAIWAYLAWAILSIGWALDPALAWFQLQTLIQLVLIAVLVADFVVQRPAIVRPVLWVYSVSAAATAVVGIQSYLAHGVPDVRAALLEDQNPATFAAVLLPAFVFGMYEMLNGERRIAGGVITALTAAGILVSGTRGAWVGCAVVVVFLLLPQLSLRRRVAAVVMALALGAVLYQLPGIPELLAERTGTAVATGGAGRTDIWAVGGTIYASAPVLGVGFANFPVAYTPEVVRAAGVTGLLYSGRAPHNAIIGTLVELGPIGLVLVALAFGPLVVRRGWGPDAAIIQAALASMLTLALFLDMLTHRKQVWLVVGIAAGLAYLARQYREAAAKEDERQDDASGVLSKGNGRTTISSSSTRGP
jgi:O-antigen ligase